MGFNFVGADRDQRFLLPPDMREWLAEDHVVWCVLDAVEQLDLTVFRAAYRADGHGRPAFDPALMVALLLYAYSSGERSSRRIERRCGEDIAYRVIAGGHQPDHATIARFRARHEAGLKALFTQVLRLLAEAGMVALNRLSLDGTKIAANASWSKNRTLDQLNEQVQTMLSEAAAVDAGEDGEYGAEHRAPGDHTPQQLTGHSQRLARLREARDRLADEAAQRQAAQDAKVAAWQARKDAGHGAGRRPNPTPPSNRNRTEPRANTTDPDCRAMKTKHTLVPGYNAQAVVTDNQVVVGVMLTQKPVDRGLLHPLLDICRDQLTQAGITPRLRTVLADAGYASEDTFTRAETDKLRLLIPLAKDTYRTTDTDPGDGKNLDRLPATARAQRRLRHWKGRADYAHRGRTVEPVFGQIKTRQNLTRFTRRGLTACESEWHLAATAHNLLKLHTHRSR